MKHTSRFIVATGLVVSLAIATALTGCGAKSSYSPMSAASSAASYEMGSMMDMEMPAPAAPQVVEGEAGRMASFTNGKRDAASDNNTTAAAAPVDQPRKLVKNSDITLETKEFDTALESILKMVSEAGGYIDSQSVNGASLRSDRDYYERAAYITARIPADKLDSFTAQAGELCNIISHTEGVSDITDSYYDAQSRLDVLKIKEARLTELLAKAEKLEDIIQLEDALSTCQYEIDSLTGQLRRMDSQVSYSTCTLNLQEVVEYSDVAATPATFGERLSDSLRYSWRNLSNSVQDTIIRLIERGPVTIFYLLLWGGILYLVYRLVIRRRLRERRAVTTAEPAPVVTSDNTPPTEE